jgi:hypothetical protein
MGKQHLSKFACVALSCVLALGVAVPFVGSSAFASGTTTVKTAEELQAALEKGGSIELEAHIVSETGFTVSEGVSATLDLNGKNLTVRSGHAITNEGKLTVEGSGQVMVNEGDKSYCEHSYAAFFNAEGATATLNGGSFTRENEHRYYVIENKGTMNFGGKVRVTSDDVTTVSLIENGWSSTPDEAKNAQITVNGGYFSGGVNTIKNDEYAQLTINGGTFKNTHQYVIMNWDRIIINGGTFEITEECKGILFNGYTDLPSCYAELTINGGTFTGGNPIAVTINEKGPGPITVKAGTFSHDGADVYIPEGYCYGQNNHGNYVVEAGHTFSKNKAKFTWSRPYSEKQPVCNLTVSCTNCDEVISQNVENVKAVITQLPTASAPGLVKYEASIEVEGLGKLKSVSSYIDELPYTNMVSIAQDKVEVKPASIDKGISTMVSSVSAGDLVGALSSSLLSDLMLSESDASVELKAAAVEEKTLAVDAPLIEEALKGEGFTFEVQQYLDLSLSLAGLGEGAEGIYEMEKPVAITVGVTDDCCKLVKENHAAKTYKVVRVHEDMTTGEKTTDVLDATFNANKHEITFETDRFSTYAFVSVSSQGTASGSTESTDEGTVSDYTSGNTSSTEADSTESTSSTETSNSKGTTVLSQAGDAVTSMPWLLGVALVSAVVMGAAAFQMHRSRSLRHAKHIARR